MHRERERENSTMRPACSVPGWYDTWEKKSRSILPAIPHHKTFLGLQRGKEEEERDGSRVNICGAAGEEERRAEEQEMRGEDLRKGPFGV